MPTFEIGIPVKRSLEQAKEAITRALSVHGVTSIHVSINSPGAGLDYSQLALMSDRVRVTLQRGDLGLYGNLRFLVETTEAEYFSWLSFDDIPSKNLFQCVLEAEAQGLEGDLFVPPMAQQMFSVEEMTWYGPQEPWTVPSSNCDSFHQEIFFGFRTHYIYGVWRSKALRRLFPQFNFDWLDSYLLSRVYAQGRAKQVASDVFIVGIVDKFPTKVGKVHRFIPWFVFSLPLAFSFKETFKRFWWFAAASKAIWETNHFWNLREAEANRAKHLGKRA